MKLTKSLEDRITEMQADIDRFIDDKVKAQKEQYPGLPAPVLRGLLTNRNAGCQCRQYLHIIKQDGI